MIPALTFLLALAAFILALGGALISVARLRGPDFRIGEEADPYLERWWLVPRNRWFNIYLHHILHDDTDRALHDHPWWNLTLILHGGYREVTPKGERLRRRGQFIFRRARALHRLVVGEGEAWTLFITGPIVRGWGFQCPQGWVPWTEFVDPDHPGKVGRGCGEGEA